jgi:hypothetical protein
MQTTNQQTFSRRMILMRILPTLIYAAVIPYLLYRVGTQDFHLSSVDALLLAAVSPVVGLLVELVRKRQLNAFCFLVLAGLVAKVVSALLFNNARLVLISDSLVTGAIGLLLLGSVLVGKPLVALLATSMYAKSPEEGAKMKQRLQASGVQRHLLVLTAIWGVGLLLLLAISVLLTFTLPVALVVLIRPLIDYGVIGALVVSTIAYGYAARNKWRQQQQAAQ